jgi:uncharacterized membrane protein
LTTTAFKTIAVTAAATALATLVPVALYQGKVIDVLPDPRGPWFDSEKVTDSKSAHPLGIPDSFLGLASYSITIALLVASRNSILARRGLRVKLIADGSLAAFNFGRQLISFHKLCSWCSGTAVATAFMVPAANSYLNHLEEL